MRPLALVALLTAAASAQPALVAEATVDQDAYAYGEPITFRYTIRNEGTKRTAIWGSWTCKLGFDYEGVEFTGRLCTLDVSPTWLEPGGHTAWEWRLDPDSLGLPEVGGTQTITGRVAGSCGPEYSATGPCPDDLTVSVSFEAPAYLGGFVGVQFATANADSVDALRAAYGGVVTDGRTYSNGSRYEQWKISGATLGEAVAALQANDVVGTAYPIRIVPEVWSHAVTIGSQPTAARLTPPAPNPTRGLAAFVLHLQTTEEVAVDVVDRLGRRVAVLHDGPLAGGVDHAFRVDGDRLPAGVYIVRVVGETARQSRRVTVVR